MAAPVTTIFRATAMTVNDDDQMTLRTRGPIAPSGAATGFLGLEFRES